MPDFCKDMKKEIFSISKKITIIYTVFGAIAKSLLVPEDLVFPFRSISVYGSRFAIIFQYILFPEI